MHGIKNYVFALCVLVYLSITFLFYDIFQDGSHRLSIDIWKSRYSSFYYGCSERGPHFTERGPHFSCKFISALCGVFGMLFQLFPFVIGLS